MSGTTLLSFPLSNGITILETKSGTSGQIDISLSAAIPPTAGLLKIEGLQWSGSYRTLDMADALDLSLFAQGAISLTDYGHYRALRFTITQLAGGAGDIVGSAYTNDSAFPSGLINGSDSINTKSLLEVASENGKQFYVQFSFPTIPMNQSYDVAFMTGDSPVVIRESRIYAAGDYTLVQLYRNSNGISGGYQVDIQNFNDVAPATSSLVVVAGGTATSPGTPWGDASRIFSAGGQGSMAPRDIPAGGLRILAPNKKYLLRATNSGSGVAYIDYFMSWSEAS